MENGPFIDGLPIQTVIFYSYVSLPEGNRFNRQLDPSPQGATGAWGWAATARVHAFLLRSQSLAEPGHARRLGAGGLWPLAKWHRDTFHSRLGARLIRTFSQEKVHPRVSVDNCWDAHNYHGPSDMWFHPLHLPRFFYWGVFHIKGVKLYNIILLPQEREKMGSPGMSPMVGTPNFPTVVSLLNFEGSGGPHVSMLVWNEA